MLTGPCRAKSDSLRDSVGRFAATAQVVDRDGIHHLSNHTSLLCISPMHDPRLSRADHAVFRETLSVTVLFCRCLLLGITIISASTMPLAISAAVPLVSHGSVATHADWSRTARVASVTPSSMLILPPSQRCRIVYSCLLMLACRWRAIDSVVLSAMGHNHFTLDWGGKSVRRSTRLRRLLMRINQHSYRYPMWIIVAAPKDRATVHRTSCVHQLPPFELGGPKPH